MKIKPIQLVLAAMLLAGAACNHQPNLEINLSDKFEGQEVEVINFLDSTSLGKVTVANGKARFTPPEGEPVFTAVMIDGRTRAFYITEPGTASINDSTNSAAGTPLNDKFATLLSRLDSIENLDDMDLYLDFVKNAYNDNKETPLGSYFGIEWIKYADLATVDSLLAVAPQELRESPKTKYYLNYAQLRDKTSPGKPYVDFEGETADGKTVALSSLITPGKYTLVDFWASWCPYCIKELPEMGMLYDAWKDRGLEIVGVAVRDVPEDSKAAVGKHNMTWPIIYNTQRRPYDIYGYSGIPHHMLIGPDGTIISRGESLQQIEARLQAIQESDVLEQAEP